MAYYVSPKKTDKVPLGTAWTKMTNTIWTPPNAGALHVGLYVNCKFALKTGVQTGDVCVRLVRAPYKGKPRDNTAYQNYTITRNGTVDGRFMFSHTWFEWAEAGRQLYWEIDRSDDFANFFLDTRYAKYYLEPR